MVTRGRLSRQQLNLGGAGEVLGPIWAGAGEGGRSAGAGLGMGLGWCWGGREKCWEPGGCW